MRGTGILARTLSQPNVPDKFGNVWQYHSRSDHHSKVACWALLFDLLTNCPLLRTHIAARKVGFGINHEMIDFKTGRKKDLDLVLCTRGSGTVGTRTFANLAVDYKVQLDSTEQDILNGFPALERVPVGSVHVALEAKACMTAHIAALPRLYDELNSSHIAIHGSANFAIATGFAVVNMATTFLSPGENRFDLVTNTTKVNKHRQPEHTKRTVSKIKEIPRRTQPGAEGFDALGIVVIEMKNDGSPVTIATQDPAPQPGDLSHYESMIHRISSKYAHDFAQV